MREKKSAVLMGTLLTPGMNQTGDMRMGESTHVPMLCCTSQFEGLRELWFAGVVFWWFYITEVR